MLGYFETEYGTLEIERMATGRDFLSTLIANVCKLNGNKISVDQVEEFDAGVSVAIQEVIFEPVELLPVSVDSYPKIYKIDDTEFCLNEQRKVKHDNKATRFANGNVNAIGFWLISFLVKKDDKSLTYDDVLDLPAGVVQSLINLITPKKPIFVRVKT
jgi:hypothetical protein